MTSIYNSNIQKLKFFNLKLYPKEFLNGLSIPTRDYIFNINHKHVGYRL